MNFLSTSKSNGDVLQKCNLLGLLKLGNFYILSFADPIEINACTNYFDIVRITGFG
jgi:hypothetical protein